MTAISCDCSFTDTDFERDRCGVSAIRRARKQYECIECEEPIKVGQLYECHTGIDSERFPVLYRTCLPCKAIRERYCPHGWAWGYLRETITECLGFDYTEVPPEDEWEDIDEEDAARVAAEARKL